MMKKILVLLLIASLFLVTYSPVKAEEKAEDVTDVEASIECSDIKSGVLMEAESGKVIFSKNENMELSPASVTKIMTLLLVAEAIAEGKINLTDEVKASAYACSMGGSQVFLKEGEVMTLEELLKCTVIASANDAAVALAEYVSGSESAFVKEMNLRCKELGMENTNFENVTGLDDTTENHYTSALDIAIMSRELIKHDIILKYSSLWQDSIRNGEFILTNTNRLVRFYDGCNGLKTGSTDKAGFCMSATAKRNDMQLIAVVMGAETRDDRNETAKKLLDYGFANYALYKDSEKDVGNIKVKFGIKDNVTVHEEGFIALTTKSDLSKIEKVYSLPEELTAPFYKDDSIGKVEYFLNGEKLGEANIYSNENIEKIGFIELFYRIVYQIFLAKK